MVIHPIVLELNAAPPFCIQVSELAVVVLPLAAWGNRFDSVPMFYKLAFCNTIEVVKGGVDSIEGAFTNR